MSDLSEAEMFALDLGRVPRCESRLRTFLLRFTALEKLREANGILHDHIAAAKELQASRCFAETLQAVLGAGNFLNWGTARGQAAGFRLRGLNKLQDTRSLDGKTSLMSYLASVIFARHPGAPLLCDELPSVMGNGIKIPLADVSEMMEMVTSAMNECQHELRVTPSWVYTAITVTGAPEDGSEAAASDDGPLVRVRLLVDTYNEIMTEVCDAVSEQQVELQQTYEETRAAFTQVVEHYGENVAAMSNEADFWNDLIQFINAFSSAQKEKQKAREAQLEQQARKAKKAAMQTPK
eukprot:CAMPEP_0117683308 /NCGR_PEP_ID=MMETSP0804-20121206/20304_1 /TAXON_ID=1074897 /ORGANISM="Tetraselmis astigmatica, Strain CCMP880" /LENGTH=293 /DNA_ID=CAMNT_0005493839 /DNA_START=461 /DNA_END=1339 /DNA_ORIENTATION=-